MIKSEVQAQLCINSTIPGAAASSAAESSKRSSQSKRLTKTGGREVTNRRRKIDTIEKILEVERNIQIKSLLGSTATATTTLWTKRHFCRPRAAATAG